MRLQSLNEGPTLTDNSNAKLLSLDSDHINNKRSLTTESAIVYENDNNSNTPINHKGLGERWEAVEGWEDNRTSLKTTWVCDKQVQHVASEYNDFNYKLDYLKSKHLNDGLEHLDLIKPSHFEVLDNRPQLEPLTPDSPDSEECSACFNSSCECISSCGEEFEEDLAEEEEEEADGEEEEEDNCDDSCDSFSEPELAALPGFVNPNYPGFQHLAHTLPQIYCDSEEDREYSRDCSRFCGRVTPASPSPLPSPCDTCLRIDKLERELFLSKEARFQNSLSEEEYNFYLDVPETENLAEDSPQLSGLEVEQVIDSENISSTFKDFAPADSIKKFEDLDHKELIIRDSSFTDLREFDSDQSSECCCDCADKEGGDREEILNPLDRTVPSSPAMEPCRLNIPVPTPVDSAAWQPLAKLRRPDHPAHRKREKTEINNQVKKLSSPRPRRVNSDSKGELYKIDSVMPEIDLDAIETHLRAAREEERRRRNDREEIRRRLATGDQEDYPTPGRKKPSLQSRLQSGMNLQICFMNDVMSDTESPNDGPPRSLPVSSPSKSPLHEVSPSSPVHQPRSLNATSQIQQPVTAVTAGVEDFSMKCMRLQAEARLALAQAKDVARAHMQRDRRRLTSSPITEMLRNSLTKVGVTLGEGRRRVSRQMLTDMNIAQLQVIVNDMHSQIELLNENLVKYLMERDELHMSQDSMLVDIEDLTRYLGAKENLLKEEMAQNNLNCNNNNNNNLGHMTHVKNYHSIRGVHKK